MFQPKQIIEFQSWMMITNAVIMSGVWITLVLSFVGIL
jgi:hypothetical protein